MSKKGKTKIAATKNGPYVVYDVKNLKTSRGEDAKTSRTMVLCRCGSSKNKPFCDGSHWYVGFKDKEVTIPLEKNGDEQINEYLGNLVRKCDDFEKSMGDIQRLAVTGKSIIGPIRTTKSIISWDEILIKGAQLATIPLNDD